MLFNRNSYLVKTISHALLLSFLACGKSEEDKKENEAFSVSLPEIKLDPAQDVHQYSGCVAAHPRASYKAELRRIMFNKDGSYNAETEAYESTDCKTDLVAIIKVAGTYVWKERTDITDTKEYQVDFTRSSLTVKVINARELDHWNGILTALPVCEAFKSESGDAIETIDMKCLDSMGGYTLSPRSAWTENMRVTNYSIYLSGLAFGLFPVMQAYHAQENLGDPALMKTFSYVAEGERYYTGGYSWSSISNNPYALSSELAGSWEACHEGNLVTFTFSGNTYVQTAEVGVGDECTGSAAYTMILSGTYSVPGSLDYVEGGHKINYYNTGTKYTVHTTAALGALFNGTVAGTTAFCSGFSFTLNTETSINGKDCKPRPDFDAAYTTVGSSILYDIILVRDNEITDSRFTADDQGSSDSKRPYYFNGELRYKKL